MKGQHPEMQLGMWVGPASLALAKDLLRHGHSIHDIAVGLGVGYRALDMALWNGLGNPKLRAVK